MQHVAKHTNYCYHMLDKRFQYVYIYEYIGLYWSRDCVRQYWPIRENIISSAYMVSEMRHCSVRTVFKSRLRGS